MAKFRIVNTKFWMDDYISNLDPVEKLLFLYFLTCPSTDICGIYEVPLKTIAVDTGIEVEMVKKIIRRFSRDKRIYYIDGWVGVRNFTKHQSMNPKVLEGIKNGLNKAPNGIKDRLDIVYDSLSHLNSNLNSNSNSNLNSKKEDPRSHFGEFQKVRLMDEEYQKLVEKYGEKNTKFLITELDGYIKALGIKGENKYKDHYAVIQNWARRKYTEHAEKKSLQIKTRTIA